MICVYGLCGAWLGSPFCLIPYQTRLFGLHRTKMDGYVAERGRFELPVVLPTHDFQSCSLDQLGHLSKIAPTRWEHRNIYQFGFERKSHMCAVKKTVDAICSKASPVPGVTTIAQAFFRPGAYPLFRATSNAPHRGCRGNDGQRACPWCPCGAARRGRPPMQ